MSLFVLLFVQLIAQTQPDCWWTSAPIPEALREAVRHREDLQTGVLSFRLERGRVDSNVIVPFRYEHRFAPGGWIMQDYYSADAGGEKYNARLIAGGKQWDRNCKSPQATLEILGSSEADEPEDYRWTGFAPAFIASSPKYFLSPAHSAEKWHFDEEFDGTYWKVQATSGSVEMTWWIDPVRDWSPVRLRYTEDGATWLESRSELAEHDGYWFPRRVEVIRLDQNGAKELRARATFEQAEFNDPSHPPELKPEHIGVLSGTILKRHMGDRFYEYQVWTGQEPVSAAEWRDLLLSGKAVVHPAVQELLNEGTLRAAYDPEGTRRALARQMAVGATTFEALWPYYVRRFCELNSLSGEQKQAAERILNDCQARAAAFCRSNSAAIEQLEGELAKLREPNSTPSLQALTEFSERRRKLLQPIEDIFEQTLKTRLHSLLTRPQRESFIDPAPRTTSQPGSRP